MSKFIYKPRSKTLDKKWKYEIGHYKGCKVKDESGEEVLHCESFGSYQNYAAKPNYNWFYSDSCNDMI